MAKNYDIEELDADLYLANEMGGDFGYQLNDDQKSFTVEQYGIEGEVEKTYTLSIQIRENP